MQRRGRPKRALNLSCTWRQVKGYAFEYKVQQILKAFNISYEGNPLDFEAWMKEDGKRDRYDRHVDIQMVWRNKQVFVEIKYNEYLMCPSHFNRDVITRFQKSDPRHIGDWWLVVSDRTKMTKGFKNLCAYYHIKVFQLEELYWILPERGYLTCRSVIDDKTKTVNTICCYTSDDREESRVETGVSASSRDAKWSTERPTNSALATGDARPRCILRLDNAEPNHIRPLPFDLHSTLNLCPSLVHLHGLHKISTSHDMKEDGLHEETSQTPLTL